MVQDISITLMCDENVWDLFKGLRIDENEDENKNKNEKKDILKCANCNSEEVILDDGNYICICGAIVCRFIDTSAEWRFYGSEDSKTVDPTRCGLVTNELLPNSSIGSIIGYGKYETRDIHIMRKYHMWNSMTYKERSLINIFDTLTVNAINSGIPKNIIDEAKTLYKKISELKISRGDNRSGLIASSIYMSCKNNKVPRSAKEIAKIFNLTTPVMTKGCKKFQEIMHVTMETSNAEDFVFRFCSKLNIDKQKREICKLAVKNIEHYGILSENTPPSLAAGSIYMCNVYYKWGIGKKDIAATCEISQVTISKCFKKLQTHQNLIF